MKEKKKAESASVFSFGFITTGTDAYGLVFTGAGITGQSTNTTFTFDNSGITNHQYFPQLQFSPNGTSAIGEANIMATNAGILQNPPGSSLRKSNPQFLLDGSSNGDSVSATANQCIITAQNNSISLTNAITGLIAGFSAAGIDGVAGQFIIGGSSNGTGDSGPGAGATALASLTVDGMTISLTNNGEIESDNSTDISGGAGQWIVDGSSNGSALNYSGSGGSGNASFTASNSTLLLNNNSQLISSFSDFTVGAEGQLVIKGNSTGVGRNAGIGTGGIGSASFAITNSALTLSNQESGGISGTSGSDISGAVGQLVLDGTSNGFGGGTTGIGENGNSSFSAQSSTISLINDGQFTGGQSNIAGGVGQIVVDGSCNSNANTGTATSGNGNASCTLNNSLLTLTNVNTITTSPSTPNNIMGAAGQFVVDGTCNSNNVSSESGSGHASLTIDNSTILIENYGSITSLQDGTLAAQLVFDGSANEQNSSPLGSGLAVLNAGSNAVIYVINEASGTISATGSVATQVYFHNASISGAPLINVSNLNPAASIEGIIFDQNSSGGSAIISLTNASLVVNTTSSAFPFSIGGLNGNSNSVVKLQTNDLQISTALRAITSFAGNITGSGKNLFIAGQGEQILSGTNTYTGSTIVSSGTLAVNGTLHSPIAVSPGAILKGTGTIYEITNIAGTLSPGNSIGIMHYHAPLIITGNLSIEITPTADVNSKVSSTSIVDLTGATIQIIPDPGAYTVGSQYTLLTSAGLTGTPTLSMPAQFQGELSFPNNSIVLTILSVPQPPPPLLPPSTFNGRIVKNQFLTQTDITSVLRWRPPVDSATIVYYQIRRNGKVIALVPASDPHHYCDHNLKKNKKYTYTIVSLNAQGLQSSALSVKMRAK
jgi:autotransporter-associated beta strand protein